MKSFREYCQLFILLFVISLSVFSMPLTIHRVHADDGSGDTCDFGDCGDDGGDSGTPPDTSTAQDCSVNGLGGLDVRVASGQQTPIPVDGSSGGQVEYTVEPGNSAAASCDITFNTYIIDGTSDAPGSGDSIADTGHFGDNSANIGAGYSDDWNKGGIKIYVTYTDSNGQTASDSTDVDITQTGGSTTQDCSASGIGYLAVNIASPAPVYVDPTNGGQVEYTVGAGNSADASCPVSLQTYVLDGIDQTPPAGVQPADTATGFGTNTAPISQSLSQDSTVNIYVSYTDGTGHTISDTADVSITQNKQTAGSQGVPPVNKAAGGATSGGTGTGGTNGTSGTSGTSGTTSTSTAAGVSNATTVAASGASCGTDTQICNPVGGGALVLSDLIVIAIKYMLGLVGIIAVLMIIVGGYQMVTSAGNEESVKKGKQTLIYAIAGVLLSVLSYSIVSIIENIIKAQK